VKALNRKARNQAFIQEARNGTTGAGFLHVGAASAGAAASTQENHP